MMSLNSVNAFCFTEGVNVIPDVLLKSVSYEPESSQVALALSNGEKVGFNL